VSVFHISVVTGQSVKQFGRRPKVFLDQTIQLILLFFVRFVFLSLLSVINVRRVLLVSVVVLNIDKLVDVVFYSPCLPIIIPCLGILKVVE